MTYEIEMTDLAAEEVRALRRYDGRRIVDELRTQLQYQPKVETRNRKPIGEPPAGFEYVSPLWELRVGLFRVFYDVNEDEGKVFIRAIRRKGQGQSTEEVLK